MCLHISSVWNDCSCGLNINHIIRRKSGKIECILYCTSRKKNNYDEKKTKKTNVSFFWTLNWEQIIRVFFLLDFIELSSHKEIDRTGVFFSSFDIWFE